MICMNYDHNKKFGLFKFHRAMENFILIAQRAIIEKKLTRRLNTIHVNIKQFQMLKYGVPVGKNYKY